MSEQEVSKLPRSFEEYLPLIDTEISKRKHKWNLSSLAWMDYDDVSQIIRLHIYEKWDKFDQKKPIQPWLNVIIANQIKNLVRNLYGNYARPCLRCEAAVDNTGCKIYTEQCDKCPLYAYWQKRKQPATYVKLPVSIENHTNEIKNIFDETSDIFRHAEKLHAKMKTLLKPIEYQVYEGLFILHLDEGEVAKKLGYISNEPGRPPGYKQIKNIRKTIINRAKKCIADGEIDIY